MAAETEPYSKAYQCTFIGCTDVAVQGHVCVKHEREGR